MTKKFKLLLVTLLIICFTSTLFGCTNSNEVTDNKETTSTTAENKTTKPTTTEPTTEEPTTEEASTEYVFKGYKFTFKFEDFNLKNDLTINPGDVIHINDYVSNQGDDYDSTRGSYVSMILNMTETENYDELIQILNDKYIKNGDATIFIPFEDDYCFEYQGDMSVIFKYIETWDNGKSVYDVYKE